MHFSVDVILPEGTEPDQIEDKLHELMEPYNENGPGGEYRDDGKWDWFQIGGRYTGKYAPDYDPSTDPENIEVCFLCGGTGDRAKHRGEDPEKQHPSGCNGCEGTGKARKWPTSWRKFAGDVTTVDRALALIEDEARAYAVLTPDGEWIERETWNGKTFVENEFDHKALLSKYPGHTLVVVDCHT